MRNQRIIGYRKNGAPIWNIMGGDRSNDDEAPTLSELRELHTGSALEDAVGDAMQGHTAAMDAIHREAGSSDLSAAQERRWQGHERAAAELREFYRAQRGERAREHRQRYGVGLNTGEPEPGRGGELRSAALRLVEGEVRENRLPDHAAGKVDELVSRSQSEGERTLAGRWVLAAGDAAYRSAFAKLLGDPQRGHMLFTGDEQAAYARAESVRAELRAMSVGTDSAGGFMVPLTLDPAIMLTSDGAINPLRRIARVVQTVTDSWQGVTSAGATAEWKAEADPAADGSPTVDEAPIPVHFGDVFVPYSYEVGMDAPNFLAELQRVMVDAAANLQVAAYTTGTGSGQPTGLITALVAAGSPIVIASDGTDVLAEADVFAPQNALPARFSGRAQWTSHIAIRNLIYALETTNGAIRFPELAGGTLLGKPWNELSNMDGVIDDTEDNYVLAYGDFMAGMVIVDRIGTTMEPIPNLFDSSTGRPTGERGAFLWFRTGSDVVVPEAFRLLNVT